MKQKTQNIINWTRAYLGIPIMWTLYIIRGYV